MSLNFDITRIDKEKYPDNGDSLPIIGRMNSVTFSMIWATMAVDMGQPEKDPEEWVRRNLMYNHMVGHLKGLAPDGTDLSHEELTRAIWDHRLLTTNVLNTTRPAWFKKLRTLMERQMDGFRIPAELLEEARR